MPYLILNLLVNAHTPEKPVRSHVVPHEDHDKVIVNYQQKFIKDAHYIK